MSQASFGISPTQYDQKRKMQIDTLKSLKEEICEIRPDLYHVPIKFADHQFVLKIQLPDNFPKSQPLIWIYPVPSHNWVTEQGRIMSPGLVNYSQNSELVCLVHEIIREMKKSITLASIYPLHTPTKGHPVLPSGRVHVFNQLYPLPPYIPELESLSGDQVKLLDKNEDMLAEFTDQLSQAEEIYKDLDSRQQHVENIAVAISNLKKGIHMQRQKIIEHYTVLNQMKENWDLLSAKHAELAQRYLPSNIEASLHSAAAVVDEKSEEIAENFLSGEVDIESFLSTYLPARSLSHLRKAKEEILNKQLQELHRYF